MSGHRWTGLIGATALAALVLGWTAVAAKAKKPLDWTALNPKFAGATFVKDSEVCRPCHDDYMKTYAATRHAQVFAAKPPVDTGDCESCHGPRSKHVEEPSAELRLEPGSKAQTAVCMQCHQGGARMGFKAGAHNSADVSCTSCHTVMARKSEKALLSKPNTTETCYTCHQDVRAEASKMSHHPIREGRMDCASCHNVHGSTPQLLLKNNVTETCFTCHTEKRGPFVWEHAPVRENCDNCHTPHGSSERNLLMTKGPFLCLSCHSYGGHVNLPRYNRVSNPYGNGCSNCHTGVHGSNHPSGAKLTR